MSSFQNDASVIASAATHVREVRDQVMSQIRSLQGTVGELGGAWQGDAARAFSQLMERYNNDSTKLQDALDNIAAALDRSGVTYTTTDDEQSSAMSRISSALG